MATMNVTQLRTELLDVFDRLRANKMDAKEAVEINNTAGKIISTAKLQLAHHALAGTVPNIPFLRSDDEPAVIEGSEKPKLASG